VEACGVDLGVDPRWEQAWNRLILDQAATTAEQLHDELGELRQRLVAEQQPADNDESRAQQAQAEAERVAEEARAAAHRAPDFMPPQGNEGARELGVDDDFREALSTLRLAAYRMG
jgi:hypothetical protein